MVLKKALLIPGTNQNAVYMQRGDTSPGVSTVTSYTTDRVSLTSFMAG